jgi:hypothetical protein
MHTSDNIAISQCYLTFTLTLKKVFCLTQDAVSPHCGDKRMARSGTRSSLSNYFVMTSYHWNSGKTDQCKRNQSKKYDCLMFIHSHYVFTYCHYQGHSFNISGKCTVHISPKETLTDNYIVTLKVIEPAISSPATKNVTSCTKCSLLQTYSNLVRMTRFLSIGSFYSIIFFIKLDK